MMEFFETVQTRRSVRTYTAKPVPAEVMEKALDAALLAPNSSNLQTWQFYWVQTPEKKSQLVKFCMNQGAARTAQELLVVATKPSMWKKTRQAIIDKQPKPLNKTMETYYGKLIPFIYSRLPLLNIVRLIGFNVIGLFRPFMRRPWSSRDIDEVCIKSATLAAENFMLAIRAQNFDTCPMEGFDERRVKKLLQADCQSRVVMVISVGERDPKGIWGQQLRFPKDWFVHKI